MRQKWLPSLGTPVFLKALPVQKGRCVHPQKFTAPQKPFILPTIDIGNAFVRDSSSRRAKGPAGILRPSSLQPANQGEAFAYSGPQSWSIFANGIDKETEPDAAIPP